jgi:hypothetical protein
MPERAKAVSHAPRYDVRAAISTLGSNKRVNANANPSASNPPIASPQIDYGDSNTSEIISSQDVKHVSSNKSSSRKGIVGKSSLSASTISPHLKNADKDKIDRNSNSKMKTYRNIDDIPYDFEVELKQVLSEDSDCDSLQYDRGRPIISNTKTVRVWCKSYVYNLRQINYNIYVR